MDKRLIAEMQCPYCDGSFRVARECRTKDGRLVYGLVECRCFCFPVVDGILMLSLAKGFGGAEEVLQPYVPLQVAAVQYLERDDVEGLLKWMRRYSPLAAELIEGPTTPYLPLAARLDLAVDREARRFLDGYGRYILLGNTSRRARLRHKFSGNASSAVPDNADPAQIADKLASYYVSRFFSPRVNALALQMGSLPLNGRILSLCCGHGVFENLLAADGRTPDVVCVDGQFLNLLITRRYSCPAGNFICHDIQFPLPFADASFVGVFSSTCLPEIPAQRTFVTEAIRVTSANGWTLFDSIWNLELGVQRVDRHRHYRFCQNFFSKLDDYLPMFDKLAGATHEVGVNVSGMPESYRGGAAWSFGAERAKVLERRADPEISVIVRGAATPYVPTTPLRPWLSETALSVSPAYSMEKAATEIKLSRLPQFAQLNPAFAPAAFPGYATQDSLRLDRREHADWLLDEFCNSRLALLPKQFDASTRLLSALA